MTRNHSPRERQRQQLQRKAAQRAPYDRILIVCEGSKTEPMYFGDIRAYYRLHTANVQVQPSEWGTQPLQVVEYAQHLFEIGNPHRRIQPRAFDQIYVVFDRDEHLNYLEALSKAQSLHNTLRNSEKQIVKFHAIASVPCFELWLLLHFEDVHAPMERHEVAQRLKRHMPQYTKSAVGTFHATQALLPKAMERADRLAQKFTPHTDPEPYTGIASLVRQLTSLRP